MHLINLLPEELRVKKARPLEIITPERVRGTAAIFIVGTVLSGWWLFLNKEIDKAKMELSGIENSWTAAEPLVRERTEFLERKAEAETTVVFLRQFLTRDVLWSEILGRISQIVPAEVWFTELSLREEATKEKPGAQKVILPKQPLTGKDGISIDNSSQWSEVKKNRFLQIVGNVSFLGSDEEMLSKINNFMDGIKKDKFFSDNFENLVVLDLRKVAETKQTKIMFRIELALKKIREK